MILMCLLNTFVYANETNSIFCLQQFSKFPPKIARSKLLYFEKGLSLLCNSFIPPSVLMTEQWMFIFIYEKFNRTET